MGLQEEIIDIKGMCCKGCSDLIELKIKFLKGVKDIKTSLLENKAFVRFNPDEIGIEKIKSEINSLGYDTLGCDTKKEENHKETEHSKGIKEEGKKTISMPKIFTGVMIFTLILTLTNSYNLANINALAIRESVGSEIKESQPLGNEPGQPSRIAASADDDTVRGSKDAPVTIIEFSDFECPFCTRFYEQTLPLIEENYIKTGKVKFIYRDFPLSFHKNAQKAAEAAECADEQGKFWEMHDKIFENQNALDVTSLKQYAKDLGLDTTKFDSCLDSGKYADEVQRDFTDGQSYGVSGTPTFFINGIEVVGAQPYNTFEQIIEQELKK